VSDDPEPEIWTGEKEFDIITGVGHVEDDRLVYCDGFERDGEHYDLYIYQGGGEVDISTGYDDGEVEFGTLVSLQPDEARRLATLLERAADYQESSESHRPTPSTGLERLKEVFSG
jgi:hypothetical protein